MTLEELRKQIDQINLEIIQLLAKRLEVTKQVARVKKEKELPCDDPVREASQLLQLHALALENGLSPSVIEEIFHLFVDYSKMVMRKEMRHAEDDCLSRG